MVVCTTFRPSNTGIPPAIRNNGFTIDVIKKIEMTLAAKIFLARRFMVSLRYVYNL
jgi:hypothetical protein